MDLHGIISISGMSGLFKVVAQSKGGVIVESLADKKRFPAFASHKISALEDICMFTTGEDKPLSEIMNVIFEKEKGAKCIDAKAEEKEILAYFEAILPDFDKERVYVSNMRKLFSWYNILQETGNLKVAESKKENETEAPAEKKPKVVAEEKPKKAATKAVKDTSKAAKTKSPAVKAAGVRKTGVA